MKRRGILARLLLWAASLAAVNESMATSSGDPCDFSGLDMEDMVRKIVRRLPSSYAQPNSQEKEFVSGFFVGPTVYHNMDKLETFGLVVGFCRGGLKLMQVDLTNTMGTLYMLTPWRTCGGKNGTIFFSNSARVTVTFQITDPTVITNQTLNESPMIHHGIPQPVFVKAESLGVTGAGEDVDVVASLLGRLFQGIVEERGKQMVTYRLRDVFNEIGRS